MSRTRPQQKRRGGVRDDSTLNIGLNRREIAELLNRIRIKLEHDSRESAAGKFGLWDICKNGYLGGGSRFYIRGFLRMGWWGRFK